MLGTILAIPRLSINEHKGKGFSRRTGMSRPGGFKIMQAGKYDKTNKGRRRVISSDITNIYHCNYLQGSKLRNGR